MIEQTQFAGGINTDVWEIVRERVSHPADCADLGFGSLVRNRRTGIYGIMQCGIFRSVPPRWAASQEDKK